MAAGALFLYMRERNRRGIRRERVFRDRTHPLEIYDDEELLKRFRFPRHAILELTDLVREDIEGVQRRTTLPAISQVCFDFGHALFPPNLSMTVCVVVLCHSPQ